ncbi:MAG: hypothetical protein ACI9DK_001832 [Vicingaceae bacterium]|jgi:hypothetical protein
MKISKIVAFFSLFIVFAGSILAQTGSLKGFVYIKNSGEPAIFVNVFLKGTTIGITTDENGYYSISKVPLGDYTIISTSLGYDTASADVSLTRSGQVLSNNLIIAETSIQIDAVTITAERQEAENTVQMSVTKLTPKQIKQMPSIGGDPDLAQYLQVLPGVVFTGDQGGQLYIRGGSPIQNKVLLDGMVVYNPFHSIGLFSVFETEIIKTADVYTGGFGAEHGGRVSSIMDIKTKDGNNQRIAGRVSASTFGASAFLEGPLSKPKKIGQGGSSFMVSYKNSYIDRTAPVLYDYADTAGLPYKFNDLYAKLSLKGSNGSKASFFGFRYGDQVNYPNVAGFEWEEYGGGTNFVLIPSAATTLIDGTIAFSNYTIKSDESIEGADISERQSSIDGFNAGMNFTNFEGENQTKFGFEMLGFRTDFSFVNNVNEKIQREENTTEIAAYGQWRYNVGRFVLEPSFRMQYYASLTTLSPEPRLGFKFNATKRLRIKGAGGFYSQNLISATSDRDVVNLFYGFLSGPSNLQEEIRNEDGSYTEIKAPLQLGRHAILGFEYDLTKYININVEGYYKWFNQLTNLNRNKLYDDNSENSDIPNALKKEFIVETGSAYGVDFSAKYNKKQLSVSLVYSWSYVDRWDGTLSYNPIWDRRHNINFLTSYLFGEDQVWSFDARLNIGSGFPLTQTTGFYENINLQGDIGQDITTQNGDLGIQYGGLGEGRLPWYHRFDVSLKRKFFISESSVLQTTASITNVYNRENIFYVNRVTNDRVNQLPFLPSVGVSLTF